MKKNCIVYIRPLQLSFDWNRVTQKQLKAERLSAIKTYCTNYRNKSRFIDTNRENMKPSVNQYACGCSRSMPQCNYCNIKVIPPADSCQIQPNRISAKNYILLLQNILQYCRIAAKTFDPCCIYNFRFSISNSIKQH